PVIGVQSIIAARVEETAVELVFTALGRNADNSAGSLAVFRTVGVTDHLEFCNGVSRGVDQNRSVRPDVIVVDAVDEEQIVRVGVAVDRKVAAAKQTLIAAIKAVGLRDSGRQH